MHSRKETTQQRMQHFGLLCLQKVRSVLFIKQDYVCFRENVAFWVSFFQETSKTSSTSFISESCIQANSRPSTLFLLMTSIKVTRILPSPAPFFVCLFPVHIRVRRSVIVEKSTEKIPGVVEVVSIQPTAGSTQSNVFYFIISFIFRDWIHLCVVVCNSSPVEVVRAKIIWLYRMQVLNYEELSKNQAIIHTIFLHTTPLPLVAELQVMFVPKTVAYSPKMYIPPPLVALLLEMTLCDTNVLLPLVKRYIPPPSVHK